MTEKTTHYGHNDCDPYNYDDADECACDYVDINDEPKIGETFVIYAGEGAPNKGSWYLDNIGDGLTNGACSEMSEGTEDWCCDIDKIANELQATCEKAVDDILDKHNLQPGFCTLNSLPDLTYRRTADGAERVDDKQKQVTKSTCQPEEES